MNDLLEPSVEPDTLAGVVATTDTTPADAGCHAEIALFAAIQAAAIDQEARHRHEVALVAGFDTHAKRAWYIDGEGGVRESRGTAAADRLRRDVWALLKVRNGEVEPLQEELL